MATHTQDPMPPHHRRRSSSSSILILPFLFSALMMASTPYTSHAFVRPATAPLASSSAAAAARRAPGAATPPSPTHPSSPKSLIVMMNKQNDNTNKNNNNNKKKSATTKNKKGNWFGTLVRRTVGTLGAALGLTVAPMQKDALETLVASKSPSEALDYLAAADRGMANDIWKGIQDGYTASAASLATFPNDNNYEAAMGALSAKAGAFMSDLRAAFPSSGGGSGDASSFDLNSVLELVKGNELMQAFGQATGFDATGTNEALQSKGAEWVAAFDGRVEETAQALGDLLGGSNGNDVLPAGVTSQEVVRTVASFLKQAAVNPAMRLQTEEMLAAVLVSGLGLATAKALFFPPKKGLNVGPPSYYDADEINEYYKTRPGLVLSRLLSGLNSSSGFLAGLLMDYVFDSKEQNAPTRAKQLKILITELGPVFIKIAQLLSVRPDIVSPVYLKELQLLQDQVKAFPSTEAIDIITANLPPGTRIEDVYVDPQKAFQEPVAAASLGQVYKAVLKTDGSEVAVKVQRPYILESITLDLYTVRLVCNVGRNIPKIKQSCDSFIEVLNNWGNRFLQECDYIKEASNTKAFARAMGASPVVKDAIVVPEVYDDISTRNVLVTQWIEGRKINSFDKSDEVDKAKLGAILAVMLNSYLVQLLETGILHADPHAGNFLVTTDGRLCILDHGLTTDIDEDRRLALVEYVAHLLAKDYSATVLDLVRLGFIPQEIADDKSKLNIVAPILGAVLEQLASGGGAKSVNVDEIGDQVEALADQYPLTIPPWFGLIVRAFSAIEGLGLGLDAKYSITNACFPYLARRLLTDDSPRIRSALKSFLYGSEQQLKVERVNDMIAGYRNFSIAFEEMPVQVAGRERASSSSSMTTALPPVATSTRGAGGGARGALSPMSLAGGFAGLVGAGGNQQYLEFDRPTMEVLQILFNKDGNFVQELVTDELVRMTDAAIKEVTGLVANRAKATPLALTQLFRRPTSGPLGNLVLLPFLPLVTLLSIFTAMAERAESLSQLTEEDKESLKTLRLLLGVVTTSSAVSGGGNEASATNSQSQGSPSSSSPSSPSPFPSFPFPFPSPPAFLRPTGGNFPFPFPFPPVPPPAANAAMLQAAMGMSAQMMQVLPEVAPGLAAIGRRFLTQLTGRVLNRLADSLEDGPGNRL